MHSTRRRFPLALPVVVLAGAFTLFAGPAPAEAASACGRYGDQQPGVVSPKHARSAVICFINRERDQRGIRSLRRHGRLDEAGRNHSSRMVKQGCFSHKCPGEKALEGRLETVRYLHGGLSRWAYGENIAYGESSSGTPREIVDAWMNSPGHRANILSKQFRDVGAGYARRGDRGYYTADFGLRQG
jgi:uncharacterized protein YkwD